MARTTSSHAGGSRWRSSDNAPRETLHFAQCRNRPGYASNGDIDGARGRLALADLADPSLRHNPHDLLLPHIWQLRNDLTAYDAAYVALAEALDSPLLTRDKRMAAAACHLARIELMKSSIA
jgi:predicted nucleic acid-binding protein